MNDAGRRRPPIDRWPTAVAAVLLLAAAPGVAAPHQVGSTEERRLEFAEATIGHADAERRLERARELQRNGLISEADLEAEEAKLQLADLELRRVYLRLVLAEPEVVLREARKYQSAAGGVRVELDLVARWSAGLETSVAESGASSLALPAVEGISNVVVSLKTVRGYRDGVLLDPTIVSSPYERRVSLMRFDDPVSVDFGLLLTDVQELLVELRYNDAVHERQVLLGKRANTGGPLSIRSEQITLDAELGGEAVYELSLERFDDASAIYDLSMEGLPGEVAFQVADPESGASFSQVFFPEGMTDRELRLTLAMPSRPTGDVAPGRPIPFVVLLEPDRATGERLAGGAGRLDLLVIPRGVAELELEAANLYHEMERGAWLSFEVRVVNTGSRALEQVELSVDVPFGWRAAVEPALFPSLSPARGESAVVRLAPPVDVVLGDYEGKIRAGSLSGDRLVQSEPKTIRLHVVPTGNPWLMGGIFLAVVVVLAGLIWAAIRLSRR